MKHIILIGFKNTGKSTLGKALAKELHQPFIDLDEEIQETYASQTGQKKSYRAIMEDHGEKYFRQLEHDALKKLLQKSEQQKNAMKKVQSDKFFILAVGGGTPMLANNRQLLKKHTIIHISAPKNVVFKRIMMNGIPTFFSKNKEPLKNFQELWDKRTPIFKNLANITIQNTGPIEKTVDQLLKRLPHASPTERATMCGREAHNIPISN